MISQEFMELFPEFRYVYSPNQSSRGNTKICVVLLHHTASVGLEGTLNHFKNSESQVSSHFVIGKDGSLVLMVPEEKRAWHGGKGKLYGNKRDINSCSIGIELVNKGNHTDPFPLPQMETLAKLTRYLVDKYNVPPDNVLGHRHTAPDRKVDPADNFDWKWLFNKVGLEISEKHPEYKSLTV